MNNSRIKGWWLQGKYHGYPNCCIEAFLKGDQCRDNVFCGTGFLPCKECSKKDPEYVLKVINTNRVCPNKFTIHGMNTPITAYSKEWDALVLEADLLWKAAENL